MRHIRDGLTYGNVVGTLALFIALGGTSFALSGLPRDRGGAAQVRPGVAHFSIVNADGIQVRGNAVNVEHEEGSGLYFVSFDRDVKACAATATLSEARSGSATDTPPPGRVTVGTRRARVLVRTYGTTGAVQDLPFSVLLACPAPDSIARWRAGEDGWTIVLASKRSKRAARGVAERFVAAGIPGLGILDSGDFDSLRAGFWVVYSGEFDTQEQAARALDAIDLPDAYLRRIA